MEAALFVTCLFDAFFPRVPEAVVRLLRREGVRVAFPKGQTCCDQPAYNSGFHEEARQMARHFLKVFQGAEFVVSPSGSCVSMVWFTTRSCSLKGRKRTGKRCALPTGPTSSASSWSA